MSIRSSADLVELLRQHRIVAAGPAEGGGRRPGASLRLAARPGGRTAAPRLDDGLPDQPTLSGQGRRPRPRALRPAGTARRGRHGGRLQGPRPPARPRRRPQAHPQGTPGKRGGPAPLPPRDPGGRPAGASQHRLGLRRRSGRRRAFLRHGIRRRDRPAQARREGRPAAGRAGVRLRPPGGAGVAARPRARHGPSRHQAFQPAADPRGRQGGGQVARPRPGPAGTRRTRARSIPAR